MRSTRRALLVAAILPLHVAAASSREQLAYPLPTPAPARVHLTPDETFEKRDIISTVASVGDDLVGDIKSLGTKVQGAITSAVAEGTDFFTSIPDADSVQSSLGLDDDQVKALPTQVLNLGNYGNYTNKGWNLRFRSFVYKQPNITQDKLNQLADKFISGTSVEQLPLSEADQARNVTAGIFVLWQGQQNVTYTLSPASLAGSSGESGGGGAVTPTGGNQTIKFPDQTTDQGDIDGFVQINSSGLNPGNTSTEVQRLSVHTEGATLGNGTAYLVSNNGLTVISDIDDILRVTRIWEPEAGLINNTFVHPFQPWLNMPNIYANWSRSIPGAHFHYLTTTPEQITRPYMDFIFKTYPGGSFDTRPQNFSDVSATLSIRKFLLEKIFQTFPERKFILVADTSNSDVMRDYPEMATEFPGQVQCILLRNTSATDSSMWFPYNTQGFKDLNQQTYMFFNVPDDLTNLDIANGHCVNASVKQNVQFNYQNTPLDSAASRGGRHTSFVISTALVGLGLSLVL